MPMIAPVIVVTSVQKSAAWYEAVLGFDVIDLAGHDDAGDEAFYAVLSCDEGVIHLGRDSEMEQAAGQSGFELTTGRFEAVHAKAKEADAEFYFDIQIGPSGDENFAIVDPDGNRLIIARD